LKLKPIGNHSPVISGKSVILFFKPKPIVLTEKLYCPNLSCSHHFFSVLREVLRGFAGLNEGDPVEFGRLFGRVSEKKPQ